MTTTRKSCTVCSQYVEVKKYDEDEDKSLVENCPMCGGDLQELQGNVKFTVRS